jgi:hypothetical protein
MDILKQKSIYRFEKSLLIDLKKTHHLGFCRQLERFSKTLFYKMLVLLNTLKCGRDF